MLRRLLLSIALLMSSCGAPSDSKESNPAIVEDLAVNPCVPGSNLPAPEKPQVPSVQFPAFPDIKTFKASGAQDANQNAQLLLAGAIADNALVELSDLANRAQVTLEKDVQGRTVEVRKGNGFESRQTFVNGVQEVIAWKDGKKRLQSIRDFKTGAFEGILISASFDKFAPIASIMKPLGNGNLSQVFVIDIGNNLSNDIRADLIISASLNTVQFNRFTQFNGGLKGQAESASLVQRFSF